jgi:hypothetical protein
VLRLLVQEALGYEEREVRVLVTRLLEHRIERALHQLPNAIAAWPNHHAPSDGRVVRQLGAHDHIVVPGAEVFRSRCDSLLVGHRRMCRVEVSEDVYLDVGFRRYPPSRTA